MRLPTSLILLLIAVGCESGSGPAIGPPVPVFDTSRTVTGRIDYFVTGPVLNARDGDGRLVPQAGFVKPTIPRRAPHFPIELLSPSGEVLAQGVTDTTGEYSLTINFGPAAQATPLVLRAYAQLNLPFGTTVRVLPSANATEPYSNQSVLGGDPSNNVMTINLAIPLDENAAAYHILEMLRPGFIAAKSGILAPFPDMEIYWEPGNGGTSRLVAGQKAELTVAGGIAGDSTSNTDAWDGPKLMRMLGEYVLAYFSNEVAPEGTPNDALLVPSAAWREGFLDFWACVGSGSPEYFDTEGSGLDGRVVRFFNIESFFDSSLGTLGPDDPNVYQDPSVVGIGSRFTVAEVLWDLHDANNEGGDTLEFPLFLTMRLFETIKPGSSYPYLYTLLDEYVADGSLSAVRLEILLAISPEDQGITYPATHLDGSRWPRDITAGQPGDPIGIPFDATLADMVDAVNPVPLNVEIGEKSQRYFTFNLVTTADVTAALTTTASLQVEFLDLVNNVLASGTGTVVAQDLPPDRYIVRVRSLAGPVDAVFDLRLQTAPP
ncbi:MAG: hypothetical protein ACYTDU_05795 [Planctomycetota bacterium]